MAYTYGNSYWTMSPRNIYPTYAGLLYNVLKAIDVDKISFPFASLFVPAYKSENDSDIKKYLDSWYRQNIEEKGLSSYIADSGFCNDRSLSPVIKTRICIY